jgi:hypothetical protein
MTQVKYMHWTTACKENTIQEKHGKENRIKKEKIKGLS